MRADRWEIGSSFPLMWPVGDPPERWLGDEVRWYGCGRHALRALISFGRDEYGWKRAHLPSYYCPEVVESIGGLVPVARYRTVPGEWSSVPEAGPGDVVVAVSYFGAEPRCPETPAALVVDVTHDPVAPWLADCPADYVFASLRKTMPLPDGGMIWSPRGRALPPVAETTDEHLATVGQILSAMALKTAYREGVPLSKEAYRALYRSGEKRLRHAGISGMSPFSRQALRTIPAVELRRVRIANAELLASQLSRVPGVTARARPFGVVLEFDSVGRRDDVRAGLIARDVYPAVLWTLTDGGTTSPDVDFSRRMLYLHSDIRWNATDLTRTASTVAEVCRACPPPVVPATVRQPCSTQEAAC